MAPARPTHTGRQLSVASLRSLVPTATPRLVHTYLIPLLVLTLVVIASASQTVTAHYLMYTLDYNQPFFTFWLTHCSFSIVFPLHMLVLKAAHPRRKVAGYLEGLRDVVASQFGKDRTASWKQLAVPWFCRVSLLMVLLSIPAIAWFIAVVFTGAMDVTVIYATASFHAYAFSIWLLKIPLSKVMLGAITLAFAGVVIITLAGLESSNDGSSGEEVVKNRFLGDVIMAIGGLLLGLYEVVYKLLLPPAHGGVSSAADSSSSSTYTSLPSYHSSSEPPSGVDFTPTASGSATPVPDHAPPYADSIAMSPPNSTAHRSLRAARKSSSSPLLPREAIPDGDGDKGPKVLVDDLQAEESDEDEDLPNPADKQPIRHVEDDALPEGLYANFLVSCIGVATFGILSLFIPICHWTGIETFRWPDSPQGPGIVLASLSVVAFGGAIYNAGIMWLIGVWGPTTSSVANLLAIGLVAIVDAVWLGNVPDLVTIIGVVAICAGFGVMLYEGEG